MSAAEVARLNRGMKSDSFLADLARSTVAAKGVLKQGCKQHSDVEGKEAQDTAAWNLMGKAQQLGFRS